MEWYEHRKNSILLKMDPRMKLYLFLIFGVSLWFIPGIFGIILPFAALLASVFLGKVSCLRLIQALFFPFIHFMFLFFLLLIPFRAYTAGIVVGKLFLLVFAGYILTAVIRPIDFLDGLIAGFGIKKGVALRLLLILNFIPLSRKILYERSALCAYREHPGEKESGVALFRRHMVLLIPSVLAARDESVARRIAMKERGYHAGNARQPMKPLCYSAVDFLMLLGVAVYVVIGCFLIK